MEDSAAQEQPFQRLQVGSLEEGLVPPNIVRPAIEVKIVKPDEGKGMVPPSLVPLPVASPSPTIQSTPPVPGLVPPNTIPPVQTKPSQQGKPRKQ